jgi:indolepyruvate ferredoxin oxidoreductase
VQTILELESTIDPSSTRLVTAVAKNYFKLLAYKDEYEVARLHAQTGFLADLRKNFRNDFKVKFHFSPPLFARTDPATGRPKKYAFGAWVLPVLRVLAGMRRLRGGPFDVFGWSAERRLERQLIAEYQDFLDLIERDLDANRLALAVELAELPDSIRGFGPIKLAAINAARQRRVELLERWNSSRTETLPERPIEEQHTAA